MGIFFMGWKLIKIIKILREILKNVIKINYNNTHIEVVLFLKNNMFNKIYYIK